MPALVAGVRAGFPRSALFANDADVKLQSARVVNAGALRFKQLLVPFFALTGFLLLGVAVSASRLAANEPARRSVDLSAVPPTAVQTAADRPVPFSERPCVLHRRSHKHLLVRPDSVLPCDPINDDGTSRDPDDDDDTTNDLSVNNDSDVPDFSWCHESVCFLIGLEAGFKLPWRETPSELFPGFQRLRC
jgi:hypothetical protein